MILKNSDVCFAYRMYGTSPFSYGIEMAKQEDARRKQAEEAEAIRMKREGEMEYHLSLLRTTTTLEGEEDPFSSILKLIQVDKTLAYFEDDEGDSPIRVAVRHNRYDVVHQLLPYYQHILIPHDVSTALALKWIEDQKKIMTIPEQEDKSEELQCQIRNAQERMDKDRVLYGNMLKKERDRVQELEQELKKANDKIERACQKMFKAKSRITQLEQSLADYKEVEGVLPKKLTLEEAKKLLTRSLHKNGVYRRQLAEVTEVATKKRKVSSSV